MHLITTIPILSTQQDPITRHLKGSKLNHEYFITLQSPCLVTPHRKETTKHKMNIWSLERYLPSGGRKHWSSIIPRLLQNHDFLWNTIQITESGLSNQHNTNKEKKDDNISSERLFTLYNNPINKDVPRELQITKCSQVYEAYKPKTAPRITEYDDPQKHNHRFIHPVPHQFTN